LCKSPEVPSICLGAVSPDVSLSRRRALAAIFVARDTVLATAAAVSHTHRYLVTFFKGAFMTLANPSYNAGYLVTENSRDPGWEFALLDQLVSVAQSTRCHLN
jgi:hypothetical protein